MRVLLIVGVAFLGLSTVSQAQDRLFTLNVFNTPTIVEVDITGTTFGSVKATIPLPFHFVTVVRPDVAIMAGSRYVAWPAQIGLVDCREFIAVFDRRTRAVVAVPGIDFACTTVQLVGDRRRPRIFVHRFASAFGVPGHVGVVDPTLTYRPLLSANWVGTAFAYAPDTDQFFVTRVGTPQDPRLQVVAFDASTGDEISSFAIPLISNSRDIQMTVTSDGRRVFLYGEGSIRLFDVGTGTQIAESLRVDLDGFASNRLELDETRGILLVPHRGPAPGYVRHLLALNASTLALLGEGNPGGYGDFRVFQPLKGRGAAGAYVLMSPPEGADSVCWTWIDALDGSGIVRAHADIAKMAGLSPTYEFALCSSAARLLSVPGAPTTLAPTVNGRRVTLRWTQPDNTSAFELEAGLGPGRRDITVRLGLVTTAVFDAVPPNIYYLRLRAINEVGKSAASNEVTVVVP